MYVLYSLLTAAGMFLLSPYFLIRGLIRGKYLDNIPERLGWKFPAGASRRQSGGTQGKIDLDPRGFRGRSAGRVALGEAAQATIPATCGWLFPRPRLPARSWRASGCNSPTRFSIFPWTGEGRCVAPSHATQAAAVIIVETEIWPNFLRECRRAGVPVIFVNGRLSERSFRGFRRALSCSGGMLRGFLKSILNDASLFLMQSEQDAARLLAWARPKQRVLVTGNLKYDLAEPPESPLSVWLEEELARNRRRPVLIAGSVMANEEAAVLRAFADVEREFPSALLILAPRKPEQFDNAAEIIARSGRKLVRRREITLNGAGNAVLGGTGECIFARQSRRTRRHLSASRTPCLSADRWFPAAGIIFLSRLRSAKFRSTDLRWKISGRWPQIFLEAGAAIRGEQFGRFGICLARFAQRSGARRAHGSFRAGIGGSKSWRDASVFWIISRSSSSRSGAECEALLRMAQVALAAVRAVFRDFPPARLVLRTGHFQNTYVTGNSHQRWKPHGRRHGQDSHGVVDCGAACPRKASRRQF